MDWRVARSLDELLDEVNAVAPKRSKASDGGIGDPDHRAKGWTASDHNPWAPVGRGGVVTARDFTHDPADGLDCHRLAEHLRRRALAGDRRIKYVIWDRRIASASSGWAWRPYGGSNPHTKHLHLSVAPIQSLFDNAAAWGWQKAHAPAPKPKPTPKPVVDKVSDWGPFYTGRIGARTVSRWDCGTDVRILQVFIGGTTTDGYFGSDTEAAVEAYQRMRGYTVDGIVGPQTWAPILRALGV